MESFSNSAFNSFAVLLDETLDVDLFSIEFKGKPFCLDSYRSLSATPGNPAKKGA